MQYQVPALLRRLRRFASRPRAERPTSPAGIGARLLTLVAAAACAPYGPPIPGSGAPAPVPMSGAVSAAPETSPASAPGVAGEATVASDPVPSRSPFDTPSRFRSRQDSVAWVEARRRARADKGLRVVVSLDLRTLWLLRGLDTLRVAPVAIGTEQRLVHGTHTWVFETPRGTRRVLGKAADPIWTPPLWHYVEMAQRHGLELKVMPPSGRVALANGERLEVRDSLVGRWSPKSGWRALPVENEIVVDGVMYVPPIGTKNRIQHGQLGPYKLDVGNGYLIHGSPDASSIGRAATHGCIRLADADLEYIYGTVPVGTPVYIL